jgi:hypothetical protein
MHPHALFRKRPEYREGERGAEISPMDDRLHAIRRKQLNGLADVREVVVRVGQDSDLHQSSPDDSSAPAAFLYTPANPVLQSHL